MMAIIETGGKQYIVRQGQELKVEKLELADGETFTVEPLALFTEDGATVRLGQPTITDAKVTVKVVEQGRYKKVSVIKYKPKVRYRRNVGHRQPFTKVIVETIA